jgi:hypothetical protein
MQLALIHDSAKPKVCNHNVCFLFFGTEQQVFRLEVSMHYASRMDILDGSHDSPDQLGRVAFSVVSFCTDAIEEFSTSTQVEDEIEIVRCLEIVMEGHDVPMSSRDVLEYCDLVSDLE